MGSLEHMNLLVRGRSLDRQSPELSGRSTPNSPNRDYLHKYHTVSGEFNILFTDRGEGGEDKEFTGVLRRKRKRMRNNVELEFVAREETSGWAKCNIYRNE